MAATQLEGARTLAAAASDLSLFAASPRDRSAALTRSAAVGSVVWMVGGAVPEDPEGGGVTGDRSPVLGGGVDQHLPGPQAHAVRVDLGRRTVAELEVEGGLLDLEGRLTGPGQVAGGDRPDQSVQGPGHLAGRQPGDAAPPGRASRPRPWRRPTRRQRHIV
jgi:hypothetical protein